MDGISSSFQRLKGKVVIITGGASGIGAATSRLFVKNGATVIVADLQDDLGVSLCNDIISTSQIDDPTVISYMHCDVTDDEAVKYVVDTVVSKYGKLDIMFNNAGILGDATFPISTVDNANFRRVFDVNVYGSFLSAKQAARVMIPRRAGVILFMASVAAVVGAGSPHAYTTAKHAVVGLMKGLCLEMGQYGIRVNAISPGAVATPMLSNIMRVEKEVAEEVIRDTTPLKGVTVAMEDVAEAAMYLASEEARYVSGVNLVVDGGYTATNPTFFMARQKYLN